ncbi:MAG: hypothetical protein JSS81_08080 [Acidobacteria bacterium]|nr:hypothetical protein [Acidobacteriota bacterium]
MIKENLKRNLKRAGLLFSIFFGLMILTGINVNAQYNRDDDNYRRDRRDDRRDRRDDRRDRRDRDRDYNGGYNNGGYNNGGYNNNYGYGYMYRIAQQNGYRDGYNKGIEEYREGDRYNPEDTRPYRNGTNGYDRSMGSKDQYKQIYRQAFLQGFRQGYGQYNNRNNRRWGY